MMSTEHSYYIMFPTSVVDHLMCPSSWQFYEGKCFKVHLREETPEDAYEFCQAFGGYLASFWFQDELDFFEEVISQTAYFDNMEDICIGMYDTTRYKQHLWSDGGIRTFGNFDSNYSSHDAQCYRIDSSNDDQWNDTDCDSYERSFGCTSHAGMF